jgi:hypothetical protein
MSEHDDGDSTNLDLGAEEPTNPGIGAGEGYIAASGVARRAFDALRTLEEHCPDPESEGYRRHLEVIAHAWGELGDLCHDERRLTLQFLREKLNR